jgi:nicotinamidase-related amidase
MAGSPFLLDRDETALCVLDMQEKLAVGMPDREKLLKNARALVLAALRLGVPVLVTEQYPNVFGATVVELTSALDAQYQPVENLCFNSADEPAFLDRLKQLRRRQLLLCGLEAHVCVLQTCVALLDRSYRVQVAADAVGSRLPEHKDLALAQMRQAGAVITSAEAAVFQFLGKAGTPEFKDVLRLIQ